MKINSAKLLSGLSIIIFFTSCLSPQKKMSDQISKVEKSLFTDSSMNPDASKAKEIIGLYTAYADKYPEDTLSATYLFKAADMSSKINETSQAIELFGKMLKNYPGSKNAPYALFLQGFIYENQIGDPVRARPYYEAFLKKYPDHPIAGDVTFSLENLGKTPEELIKQFESKNPADSLTNPDTADTVSR